MFRISSALVLVAALLCSSHAFGKDVVDRPISITFSPIHLALPVFELTGEYAINPQIGLAGILGVGQASVKDSLGNKESFSVFEAGASFRYYVLGTFRHGMQLGLEALYLSVEGEVDNAVGIGRGMSVGPFVGYKFIASFGLTVDIQGGIAYTLIGAEASNDSGDSASASQDETLAILNLNFGWSF